jgi:hypothetical protein
LSKSAKVLWAVGGLVVIVGSFFLTNAIDVRGITHRYNQSYLNPEVASASKYDVKVLVPPGNGTARYDVFHVNRNTYVTVRKTAKAHWTNLGVFKSNDNGTFSVTPLFASPRRNDGYKQGHMDQDAVKFSPVA